MPYGGARLVVLLLVVAGLTAASHTPADEAVRHVAIRTNDLVHDPVGGVLWVSVPSGNGALSDSVVPLDPVTGAVGTPISVGPEPGRLAVSDDGEYLYVALTTSGTVRRVHLPTRMAEIEFSLGRHPQGGLLRGAGFTSGRFVTSDDTVVVIHGAPAGAPERP